MPQPRAQHFEPPSGPVGTKVRIWGYNLFGASIEFNGAPGTSVYNSGSNYVWATVPAGATTGPIAIATPGGTATTLTNFTVE
ncbi:MAG: IPT/TIG domain-containing protein [Bryobacteraceae bacterium]